MSTENCLPSQASLASVRYYRHRLPVRISHWINVLSLTILLLSGLGIFNAHPALYWGVSSYSGRPALLEISAETDPAVKSMGEKRGILRIGAVEFDTTGVLGVSTSANGGQIERAFPSWLTIPGSYSLAASRLWHFFFAWLFVLNGIFYVVYILVSGRASRLRGRKRPAIPSRLKRSPPDAIHVPRLHCIWPSAKASSSRKCCAGKIKARPWCTTIRYVPGLRQSH